MFLKHKFKISEPNVVYSFTFCGIDFAVACLCCYDACDCNNPLCLVKGASDCLCIRSSCCLAVNTPDKGCGCTGDENRGEICKIGCYCCDYALVMPTKLCAYASQCLCWYEVGSFPCSPEYVPGLVCTICCPCLQICPKCGCCVAPPPVRDFEIRMMICSMMY